MTPPTVTARRPAPTVDPVIEDALRGVFDPCCRDKGISVVDMGLLHRAHVESGTARIELLLTSGWCPFASSVLTDITAAAEALPGVDDAHVEIVWDEVWGPHRLSDDARAKLRFLPDPSTVGDPAGYRDQHSPTDQQSTTDDRGDNR